MPRTNIQIDTNLESADLDETHALGAVLSSALKGRAAFEPPRLNCSQAFWPADHFMLNRSAIFRDASEEEKRKILEACCRETLEEAYWIEKCGMHFAAKMSLLACSTQERMLYSLFASDEAIHFSWISRYAQAGETREMIPSPFIKLLDEVLRDGDKLTLTYIVQVVLEGWGINHYQALARDSRDEGLKKIFDQIIKDEARHHASGLILFNEQKPSSDEIRTLVEIISRLLFMVRIGPQSVVAQIEQVRGHLSRAQKRRVFEDLQCESETARKLETLKALIRSAARAEVILDELDRNQAFKPHSAVECAAISS